MQSKFHLCLTVHFACIVDCRARYIAIGRSFALAHKRELVRIFDCCSSVFAARSNDDSHSRCMNEGPFSFAVAGCSSVFVTRSRSYSRAHSREREAVFVHCGCSSAFLTRFCLTCHKRTHPSRVAVEWFVLSFVEIKNFSSPRWWQARTSCQIRRLDYLKFPICSADRKPAESLMSEKCCAIFIMRVGKVLMGAFTLCSVCAPLYQRVTH